MDWVQEFPSAVTVCDTQGIVLALNRKACETFASDGGESLIGTDLLACHPEPARTRVAEMLRSGEPNTYTIEKGGVKKLIHQSPWFSAGVYRGFVEISIPLPPEILHFKRD